MSSPHSTTSPKKEKVLLIGWDAADWKVINPLIAAGKMPNLAKFVEDGVMGNIATLQPALSPMLWSSIATGKRPYKHGIHGFSEPDPITGSIRPVTNLSRKTKAIWNILNQEQKNTITVGWWPSNPAEPLSHGVMVSNDYQKAHGNTYEPKKWPLKPGTIHPERLTKNLKDLRFHPAELNEEDLRPFLPGINDMTREDLDKVQEDPRVQSLMKIIADCTSIHSAATALMQNEPWDLMCVYYDAIDHFGHAFMKYHPPQRKQISDWDFKVFNYCVEAGYIFHDMMLGTLLKLAGEDTTVILMSDHGFHPDDLRLSNIPREPAGPAAEHRQFGIFAAKGPKIRKGERVYGANLLDICPTLLHLFGLPVGEDMDGKVLIDIYEGRPADIQRVPSWDQVTGDHGMHPSDKQISAEDSKAALDQLVALGYIEEPDADQSKALEQTVRELDYNLAQAYIDGGIFTEALTILQRLYTKWPMEHRFGFKLATCYQSLNRPTQLREIVTTVIERRIEEAKQAVTDIKALNLDDQERRKTEEKLIAKMTEPEKKKFFRQRQELVSKSLPNLFSLRYLEAVADASEKNFEEALTKLEQLDSDFGARRQALSLRGDILGKLKRWDEAKSSYNEALQIDQESPGPLLGLARVAIANRDFQVAIDHASTSLSLLFFQPRAHYMVGLAHYQLGQIEDAERSLTICVRQAPLAAAAWRLLGKIASLYKKDAHAAAFFKNQAKVAHRQATKLRANQQGTVDSFSSSTREAAENREMPILQTLPDTLKNQPSEEVITIVSGLPRSGTSLMMQIIEAAGITTFTDGKRAADESNQKGYYEHEKVSGFLSSRDRHWLTKAKGQALKVVAPLLTSLPVQLKTENQKPNKLHYRILFMEREMPEILKSQTSMLQRLGKDQPSGDVSRGYLQQVRSAKTWINAHGIPAMSVSYTDLVHAPNKILPEISAFLNAENHYVAMESVIDPSLHRARSSSLSEGSQT